jgi:hypothetical protein
MPEMMNQTQTIEASQSVASRLLGKFLKNRHRPSTALNRTLREKLRSAGYVKRWAFCTIHTGDT